MDEEIDDDPVSLKNFHNTTREYVIFLLLFISLYVTSYCFICLFRKNIHSYPECYEDAFASRITLWLCSFSLSVSIGAALLLPISIVSNEVLLLYPNSYYVQWLNSSLIQGVWNHVFLFSNVALFLFLPFSHFILESEGFPGSSKGIMARVYEALLVLGLIGLVIMGTICIVSAIVYDGPYIQSIFSFSSYYLPFLYSCVSFLGVLMLLLCTPVGLERLFLFLLSQRRPELKTYSIERRADYDLPPAENVGNEELLPDFSIELCHRRIGRIEIREGAHAQDESMIDFHNLSYDSSDDEDIIGRLKYSIFSLRVFIPSIITGILVILTVLSVLVVCENTFSLVFGRKSLPIYPQNFSLGISSLSDVSTIAAPLQIFLILYHWVTAIVGLYTLPGIYRLKPKLHKTSLTQIIGNCAVLLILSSALPVLARSLGMTNFDLLGDFGKIHWLGNFYIVVFYNIAYAFTVMFCLGTKIHGYVCDDVFDKICTFLPFLWISDEKIDINLRRSKKT